MRRIGRRELLKTGALIGSSTLLPAPLLASTGPLERAANFAWKLGPPEAGGMSRAGMDAVRAAVQKSIDARVISGAVTAVARHNKLVWYEAQGWADIDARKPMARDSLFRMMSSTKVVTAVAVLMMIEEGKLALEDPVSKFIPGFRGQKVAVAPPGTTDPAKVQLVPATRDITIKDLLTHTSGLSTSAAVPAVASLRPMLKLGGGATLANSVPELGRLPLDYQPGTMFRYSPLHGMDTLLYLVELVARTPADRFLKERIFDPLDMRRSWFNVPEAEKDKIVRIYNVKDGKLQTQAWPFGEGPFTYISGAGGLISCAHDMLNFELMLLNRGSFNGRRLLKPETVALMRRNHVGKLFSEWFPPLTGGNGFGLGVRVVEDEAKGKGRSVGAFGWGGAYGTESWADPALDMAAVILMQMDPGASDVHTDFATALRAAIVK